MVDRERFVARRVGRLTDDLCGLDAGWGPAGGDAEDFRAVSRIVAALFHYRFHAREQALSDAWEQIPEGGTASSESAELVTTELHAILDDANYTPVTLAELDEALAEESLIPLRFDIDLDDYDELFVARRGSHREVVEIPKWKGLRTVEHAMTVDENVVVHTRVKPAEWFQQRDVDPDERNLVPGHVSLKQFQNVPRADIEMLLPSIQVRFRPIDTLIVGVPALASGIAVLTTKLAPTIGLIVLLVSAWLGFREETPELDQTALVVLIGGIVTLGGFVFRQWTKLKNRRVEYLKTLSENLYFRTLGDGPGVIHTLLAAAEQQEVAEVLLGYRFLVASPGGLTIEELDQRVESWLAAEASRSTSRSVTPFPSWPSSASSRTVAGRATTGSWWPSRWPRRCGTSTSGGTTCSSTPPAAELRRAARAVPARRAGRRRPRAAARCTARRRCPRR